MTLLKPDEFELRCIASAIRQAWEECGEVPFPLYESEAEELAKAAITAICRPAADEIERLRADAKQLMDWNDEKVVQICELKADRTELLAVLREAADVIQDLDGGNSATNTGWATSEALHAWMTIRAAIAKVSK